MVKRAARRISSDDDPSYNWSALFEDWLWDNAIRNDESWRNRLVFRYCRDRFSSELEGSARA